MFVDGKNTAEGHRTFYQPNIHTPFRTTNFILQKSKPSRDTDLAFFPEFRSIAERKEIGTALRNSPRHRPSNSLDSQQNPESLCSTFMKSYVQKLKKERKRQNKKMMISKNNRMKVEKDSLLSAAQNGRFEEAPLCKMNKPNQILILQRVSHQGNLNTISVVSEDLYQKYQSVDVVRSSNRNKRLEKSVELQNRQKIDKIIRQIKNSRKKLTADELNLGQEYVDLSNMDAQLFKETFGFPKVATSSRKRGYKVSTVEKPPQRKKKKVTEFNLNNLEPWKEERKDNQFSIEEYSHNKF